MITVLRGRRLRRLKGRYIRKCKCAECGTRIDLDGGETLYYAADSGNDFCEDCYDCVQICEVCEENHITKEYAGRIGGLLIVFSAPECNIESSGVYEIVSWPFYCSWLVGMDLYENALRLLSGDIPDFVQRVDYPAATAFCPDCEQRIRKAIKAQEGER